MSDLMGGVPSEGQSVVPTSGQTETQSDSASRLNLDELPEFREFKGKVNQTIAERDRTLREMQRQHQEQLAAESRARQELERAMEQQVLSGLDEYGQMEYTAAQERRKREELERQLNEIQANRSKHEFIGTLREQYGVDPTDDSHPVLALRSVTDALYERNKQLEQDVARYKRDSDARRSALDDMPDMGGGQAVHPMTDLQRQYNQAMVELRGGDADRISRMAHEQGMQLDRMMWRKQQQQRNGA